jgi:16S rRNA processing protein RimM
MVVLGRVTAPFGVRGWVRIHPFADEPQAWCSMERWWLGRDLPEPEWVAFDLRDCREHGGALIACLDGIDDRKAAESLKGRLVAAPREELPATGEGEYYWADLIGLAVANEEGQFLGRIAELIGTGAHEVLVVRGAEDGRERLLPFVETVVREVDRAGGQVRVSWQRDW